MPHMLPHTNTPIQLRKYTKQPRALFLSKTHSHANSFSSHHTDGLWNNDRPILLLINCNAYIACSYVRRFLIFQVKCKQILN